MPKPPKPRPLERISFEIATHDGKKETVGYSVVPGLAVHGKAGRWRVSHTVSGLGLVLPEIYSFSTRKEVVSYTRKLLRAFPSIDWTASGEVVDRVMKDSISKREYAAFKKLLLG